MTKPTINITQAPPQTPRAFDGKIDGVNSTVSSIMKSNLTPSYSFGLGFSPSFQFNSPRNINLLNTLSPQRFFQVSNNLNKVVNTKKEISEKNIFNSNTPSRSVNRNNKFLNSLSSLNNNVTEESSLLVHSSTRFSSSKLKLDSEDSNNTNDESTLFSVTENDSKDFSTLNSSYDHEEPGHATPKRTRSISDNEFLTPKRLLMKKRNNHNHAESAMLKKRRISINDSPNTSMASEIETIASPPKSTRSSSIASLSKTDDDKSWSIELDDMLVSSYLKYKAFKKYNKSNVLKNISQNKVISRMLFNKSKILKTPKQVASRLFKLTKDQSKDFTSPSLNDEIDELIRTPLEELIGSNKSTNSKGLDSINTTEINAQIDKELDLIFSPAFDTNINNPFNTNIIDFEMSYKPNESNMKYHKFIKLNDVNTKAELKSSHSLTKDLNLDLNNDLHQSLLSKFENNMIPIFSVKNNLNLKMHHSQDFSSLDSIISNANPLDYTKGDIQSFIQVSINNSGMNRTTINWNSNSKIFRNNSLIFESNDDVFGILNKDLDDIQATIPFLKSFWRGFLSLLINGSDSNIINEIKVVQIINNAVDAELVLIHEFIDSKNSDSGNSNFQLIKSADLFGDDLRAILEENEDKPERLEVNPINETNNNKQDDEEDDNETVIADSSPIRNMESPRKEFRIDLSLARTLPYDQNGLATAPVFNSKLVSSQTQQSFSNPNLNNHLPSSNLPSFNPPNYESEKLTSSTPDVISPFNTNQYDLMNNRSFSNSESTPNSSIATSTPAKNLTMANNNAITPMNNAMDNQNFLNFRYTQNANQHPQLMVNLGTGYLPFNTLPPQLQDKYIEVQKQFQLQQQQQRMMYYQQQQQQQQQQQFNPYQTPLPMNNPSLQPMMNQRPGPLQNLPINQNNSIHSAPASQTTFNFNQPINTKKLNNKENPRSIKFGPMLAYNPSKSKEPQAKVKEKKNNEPMMGVIHMPNIQLSNYKPPKRKVLHQNN